ncbi:MAG: DNA repair protein RadC [Ruthenibacterium sp.]
MSEHDAHRQRVYNRFLKEGLAGFEEHNAMEFLLFLAHARGDTNSLAHSLINRFGSLANVLDAPESELETVPGVGPSSAVALKFIPQMCAYYLENKVSNNKLLDSVDAVSAFLMPKFFGKLQEEFYMIALDDRRKLLRCVCLSKGVGNATSVSVAKLIAEVTKCNATGVILAHNHPRGITLPSSGDLAVTAELYRALRMIGVELLDHFIFTEKEYLSFADTRYLSSIKENVR